MHQAISENAGIALGAFYVIAFIALVVAFFVWADRKFMQPAARRRRDKQIEAEMRLRESDRETRQRIARQLRDERED